MPVSRITTVPGPSNLPAQRCRAVRRLAVAGKHPPRFHVTFVPIVPFAARVTARMAGVIFVIFTRLADRGGRR
jgi:hypothetical protein